MSDTLPALLYQGSVNTWECDQNNHLNVRFQVERAMQGLAHFAAALEMPRAFQAEAGATLMPTELHVRFLKEAHVHSGLKMHGGVVEFGETDALLCLDMRHIDGAPGTAYTMRVTHAEPRLRRPFGWSSRTKAAAKRLACKMPDHAKPRGIDMSKPIGEATLARAKKLGATRIGGYAVTPDECDAFGRLRGEHVFGRVSDSVPNLLGHWRKLAVDAGVPETVGGAVVESRVAFRRWPRAGDLIEVHSAVAEAESKFTRLVHWLLDPVSGGAWASMEAVVITFDRATRKAFELPPPVVDARRKSIVPGMSV